MTPERKDSCHSILEVDFGTEGVEQTAALLQATSRTLLDASARLRSDSEALRKQIRQFQSA